MNKRRARMCDEDRAEKRWSRPTLLAYRIAAYQTTSISTRSFCRVPLFETRRKQLAFSHSRVAEPSVKPCLSFVDLRSRKCIANSPR
jgi:hypothetical protein